MVARTLEARLTLRLLVLALVGLACVGGAAALMTDRAIAASDQDRARSAAAGAHDSLAVELREGDSPADATREVQASSSAEGVRLTVWLDGPPPFEAGDTALPRLAPGGCAQVSDDQGRPWLACGHGDGAITVVAAIPTAAHRAAVVAVGRSMVALVTVALLSLWWALRRALRAPLAELTSLVGWTGRVGLVDRPEAPPVTSTTEIVQLSTAFDRLIGELFDALARERSNSAHIAHELRTPLTAIVAELDALPSMEPATAQAASRIRGDVARLADVIDAILVLSDRAAAAPAEIVNVADVARELAPAGAHVVAPDEALVEADERLVRLALRNLIDNANKYAGGARIVRVSREPAGVRLAVVDGGAGLDAGRRARMFDRYWRGSADAEGRGLGLALVRAVAERYAGGAEAVPGPDGRGLDVSLTLGRVVGWHDARAG
jgi:signal transduction histidine kinase